MKKIITTITGISLAVSISATPLLAESESERFQAFMQEQFVAAMESDYTSLHYSLRDYEAYGIEKPEVNIGSASWDDYETDKEAAMQTLETLESFDYDALSESEQTDYDTYKFALETTILLNTYPYFDFGFSESDGIINALTTTFTEFVFYEQQDIEDYLTCLSTVPDFVDDVIEITQIQAEAGYFLTNTMLQDTCDAIDKFVEKVEDNELIILFDQKIDAFEGLSQDQIEDYKQRNHDIVVDEYIPSYEKAEEELQKLRGSRKGDYSVYSLEDGPEYYEAWARYKTSMDTDIQGMFDETDEYVSRAVQDYIHLLTFASDQSFIYEQLEFESAEEVLQYLQEHLDYFPEGPEVTYTATYLDPSVASDSIVAYYLEPPVDDLKDNVIKINGNAISDTNELYSTLAHEGFPGHLFQTTYDLASEPTLLRTALSMMGYQEGWGMYAELQAWDVAYLSEEANQYQALMIGMNYALDAAVDLGVNGLGWSANDVSNYLDSLGLNTSIAQSLYDFVCARPGALLPYGVGLANFKNLEYEAKTALGDAFDQKEFNTVLLDGGDRPFKLVEKDVVSYIESKGGTIVEKETDKPTNTDTDTTQSDNRSSGSSALIILGGVGLGILAAGAIIFVFIHTADRKRKQ